LYYLLVSLYSPGYHQDLHSFPTRRSSDLGIIVYIYNIRDARKDAIAREEGRKKPTLLKGMLDFYDGGFPYFMIIPGLIMLVFIRSEEHTSELQSRENLVCRLLLEKQNKYN